MFKLEDQAFYLKGGKFVKPDGAQAVDRFFNVVTAADVAGQPPVPIVVWFHGGLVDTAQGEKTALEVGPVLQNSSIPAFFIWESGIGTMLPRAIVDFLLQQIADSIFTNIKRLIESRLGLGLAAADPNAVPQDTSPFSDAELAQLMGWLDADPKLDAYVQQMAGKTELQAFAFGAAEPNLETLTPEEYVEASIAKHLNQGPHVPGDMGFGLFDAATLKIKAMLKAAQLAQETIARFWKHRDHGISQTIIEELMRGFGIGKLVWDEMKEDNVASFSDSDSFGGHAFLVRLKAHLAAHPNRRVVLIGHSTGAIYICEFLKAAHRMGIAHRFDVRFLAAAVRMDLMSETIDQYGSLIGDYRAFGMSEEREHAERLLDPVVDALSGNPKVPEWIRTSSLLGAVRNIYIGSLLYMVSGAFEDEADTPLVGMQRYYTGVGDHDPYATMPIVARMRQYTSNFGFRTAGSAKLKSLVWAQDLGDTGFESDASTHSECGSRPETLSGLLL